MPARVQLSRRKGWRKPEGAVVVARPSRWGNNQARVVRRHSPAGPRWDVWLPSPDGLWRPARRSFMSRAAAQAEAAAEFSQWLTDDPDLVAKARAELAGRDLACWCRLDEPCHADVLLEIANTPGGAVVTAREAYNVDHLQSAVSDWQRSAVPHPDPIVKACKLAEEAGEVAGAAVKMAEGRATIADLADEIGDVMIVLAGLCDAAGLSLVDCALARWNGDVRHRQPRAIGEVPRG